MAISFRCDHCGKLLNTSDDKAGRQAKCPGCGQAVTVPEPLASDRLDDDDDDEGLFEDVREQAEARPASTATQTCPMCGAENPAKARQCQACGEVLGKEGHKARRGHKPLEVGQTLSTTWDIFKDNLLVTVVGALITTVLMVVWIYATLFSFIAIVSQFDPAEDMPIEVAYVATPISALCFLALAFLAPGYARVMLGVARGDDVNLGALFSGGRFFIRGLFISIVFYGCVVLGVAACVAPGVFVVLVWWPYMLILVDEDAPGFSCLNRARELMQGHWMEVFLIGMIGNAIHMVAGQCCISGLFSQAFLSLLMAVTYVRISGQLTAEEQSYDDEDDEDDIDE